MPEYNNDQKLIKDQIEQFALALKKILSNFLGYKSEGEITEGVEISNEQIKNELNIDVADILSKTISFESNNKK